MIKRQRVQKSVANVNGQKPTKFFLNLEKQKAINTRVRQLMTLKTLLTLKTSTLVYVNFKKPF